MSNNARYLRAKRSVDDRSLNSHVAGSLRAELQRLPSGPVRVLEVGAGTGSMLARMIDWGLVRAVDYTALDEDGEALAEALRSLPKWAERRGFRSAASAAGELTITGEDHEITFRTVRGDLREITGGGYDLLVANAVLDLVDLSTALPALWWCLVPAGLYWFTINFDGETIFQPELDAELDAQIARLYHRTMDERVRDGRPAGDSRTGRRLFAEIPASGAEILAAGASDWVVHPTHGRYPEEEDLFLHYIIDTIEGALWGHSELDPARLREWVRIRHRQVEGGELVFVAHQLDFFGRVRRPRRAGSLERAGR